MSGAVDQYSAAGGRRRRRLQQNQSQCWQQFYAVYPARCAPWGRLFHTAASKQPPFRGYNITIRTTPHQCVLLLSLSRLFFLF